MKEYSVRLNQGTFAELLRQGLEGAEIRLVGGCSEEHSTASHSSRPELEPRVTHRSAAKHRELSATPSDAPARSRLSKPWRRSSKL